MYRTLTLQRGGSRHRHCQDRFLVQDTGKELLVAVADGHGSAPYTRSGLGARFACRAAIDLLRQVPDDIFPAALKTRFDRMVQRHLAFHPLEDWEKERAQSLPSSEAVYGTTLLCARITDKGATVFQLGDGEICVLDFLGNCLPALPSDPNCVGNITSSLVNGMEFCCRHFRTVHYSEPIGGIVLTTDGCEGGSFPAAWAMLPDNQGVLEKIMDTTNHGDDQTLVLAFDPAAAAEAAFLANMQAYQQSLTTARIRAEEEEEYARLNEFLVLSLKKLNTLKADPTAYKGLLARIAAAKDRFFALDEKLKGA